MMYSTYHLASAQETIIVEEDDDFGLTDETKAILDERLRDDEKTYLSADDSISQLNKKYGL